MFAILRWKYSWFSLNQNTSDTEIDVFPCYADLVSISLFCSLGVYVDFQISTFNFSASLYYYENGIILLLKRLILFFWPKILQLTCSSVILLVFFPCINYHKEITCNDFCIYCVGSPLKTCLYISGLPYFLSWNAQLCWGYVLMINWYQHTKQDCEFSMRLSCVFKMIDVELKCHLHHYQIM